METRKLSPEDLLELAIQRELKARGIFPAKRDAVHWGKMTGNPSITEAPMKPALILVPLLLAGCATPGEIMQTPPDAKAALKQGPALAAACISRNIDKRSTNIISDRRPTPEGWELVARVTGEVTTIYLIADLRAGESGTLAELWTPGLFASGRNAEVQELLRGC
mgnify:FL=1